MFEQMKYIIVKNNMGREVPIIFSDSFAHGDIYQALVSHRGEKVKLVSAGFVVHHPKGLDCFGRSVTLGVKAREVDSEIVSTQFGVDYE